MTNLCYVCELEIEEGDGFSPKPLFLLRASNQPNRQRLERKIGNEKETPEFVQAHTSCVDDPGRLDWPEYSALADWAIARMGQLEREIEALKERPGERK